VTTPILRGAVDCDVHCQPSSISELLAYLDPYWHEYIRGGRLGVGSYYPPYQPTSARPEARAAGAFPPQHLSALREQLLDPYQARLAILNCVLTFNESRNPYYQVAMARAVNEWVREQWLDQDDRLRASILVPVLHPEAAAEEIDRVAEDPRFVQILLPIRSETPWGNVRWRALHEAAARHDLPFAMHAWGGPTLAPTATGTAATYFEDSLYNSQIVASAQVLSLVAEGVFERYPSLRVCLSECGFTWVPSIMWRYDKDWKALWRETPWVKRKPSEYIKDHMRATTSPTQIPSSVPTEQVGQLAEMLGAPDFLMYSSDYPHDHGDDGTDRLLELIGEQGRQKVTLDNAASFYRLGL
jgi:predicted TIM-barrel fold metal-dependent hydrolase